MYLPGQMVRESAFHRSFASFHNFGTDKRLLQCRNAYYAPHTHKGVTTHLILRGTFTIQYPKDENSTKETFGPGARIDVDAGRLHEVWIGPQGCQYIIGE
jgi:hypothetical protein